MESFYQDLIQSVENYAIFRLDLEGTILSWNRGAEIIKGFTPQEVIGRSFERFYVPEDIRRHKPREELSIALKTGKYREEGWRVRKDGTRFWANVTITAIKNASGQVEGFSKITSDLTQDYQAKVKVNQTLDLALRSAKIGVFDWNLKTGVLNLSRQLHEIFGFGPEVEVRDISEFSAIVSPEYKGIVAEAIKRALENDEEYNLEYTIHHPQNELHWMSGRGLVLKDADGSPEVFVGVVFNIDREKSNERLLQSTLQKMSEELESAQASLIQSAKMSALGEMAGGIAHEINTPLAAIKIFAQKIARSDVSDKDAYSATRISETASKIGKIITGLKSFARNAEMEDFVEIPFKNLLDNVFILCQNRFQNHGVILDLQDLPDITLSCRPIQIEQVFMNLLNNAFDATEESEQKIITLSTHFIPGEDLRFSISNQGELIPEEIRAKIMDPFFTTKPIGKGTGLGLSISLGILKSHGGDLILEAGAPTTFTMVFPKHLIKE
jgi:PAS domain S-box-containing protein